MRKLIALAIAAVIILPPAYLAYVYSYWSRLMEKEQ